MAKVIFKLKEPNGTKATLIHLIFSYGYYEIDSSGKKKYKYLKVSTGERILPKFWIDKPIYRAKVTRAFPEHPEFNAWLDKLNVTINSIYRRYRIDGIEYPKPSMLKLDLKKELGLVEQEKRVSILSFIEEYNREVTHLKKPNTIKKYKTTLEHLKNIVKAGSLF